MEDQAVANSGCIFHVDFVISSKSDCALLLKVKTDCTQARANTVRKRAVLGGA